MGVKFVVVDVQGVEGRGEGVEDLEVWVKFSQHITPEVQCIQDGQVLKYVDVQVSDKVIFDVETVQLGEAVEYVLVQRFYPVARKLERFKTGEVLEYVLVQRFYLVTITGVVVRSAGEVERFKVDEAVEYVCVQRCDSIPMEMDLFQGGEPVEYVLLPAFLSCCPKG